MFFHKNIARAKHKNWLILPVGIQTLLIARVWSISQGRAIRALFISSLPANRSASGIHSIDEASLGVPEKHQFINCAGIVLRHATRRGFPSVSLNCGRNIEPCQTMKKCIWNYMICKPRQSGSWSALSGYCARRSRLPKRCAQRPRRIRCPAEIKEAEKLAHRGEVPLFVAHPLLPWDHFTPMRKRARTWLPLRLLALFLIL